MHKEIDRRTTRSSVARFALDYQLEACRRDASLWAMFVADHTGTCVAQVGDVERVNGLDGLGPSARP